MLNFVLLFQFGFPESCVMITGPLVSTSSQLDFTRSTGLAQFRCILDRHSCGLIVIVGLPLTASVKQLPAAWGPSLVGHVFECCCTKLTSDKMYMLPITIELFVLNTVSLGRWSVCIHVYLAIRKPLFWPGHRQLESIWGPVQRVVHSFHLSENPQSGLISLRVWFEHCSVPYHLPSDLVNVCYSFTTYQDLVIIWGR